MIRIVMVSLFCSFVCLTSAHAVTEASVTAGSYVESNTYYQDLGDRADAFFRLEPKLLHKSYSDVLGLETDLGGSYNKYIQYPNQDYFDYNAGLTLPLNKFGKFGGHIGALTKKISEPAVTSVIKKSTGKRVALRVERSQMSGNSEIFWKMSDLSKFKLGGSYSLENYADKSHQYLNNYGIDSYGYYEYQFLPETMFFIGGEAGALTYPKGLKNKSVFSTIPSHIKNDSIYWVGKTGINGRLAEKTRVMASGGFLIRQYKASSSFSEPIFNLKVEEQFGPKDLLMAGYDYEVHDSKWTNYVVDQSTYIGYARILGDQILLLTRISYTYSSYSKPNKREDQRLAGSTRVDYSFSPSSKITWKGEMDLLNSDSYDTLLDDGEYDGGISYEYFKTGFEFTQYF